ncbi:hypothetical protein SAMN04487969_14226 [Paenibacillus algorifonticola]|uniref:Uncharacterized protein n=1 Tax=Paenibacillus algorifonticola TaxID=684063 RepID=A0A1I2IVR7_9BACL|nr:hypothetical protein [Paenibacillus algorifonticola]SFF45830.1 hypothetical protein SAMN04487969_14226 [Paenibacillus algorifonticola]
MLHAGRTFSSSAAERLQKKAAALLWLAAAEVDKSSLPGGDFSAWAASFFKYKNVLYVFLANTLEWRVNGLTRQQAAERFTHFHFLTEL